MSQLGVSDEQRRRYLTDGAYHARVETVLNYLMDVAAPKDRIALLADAINLVDDLDRLWVAGKTRRPWPTPDPEAFERKHWGF